MDAEFLVLKRYTDTDYDGLFLDPEGEYVLYDEVKHFLPGNKAWEYPILEFHNFSEKLNKLFEKIRSYGNRTSEFEAKFADLKGRILCRINAEKLTLGQNTVSTYRWHNETNNPYEDWEIREGIWLNDIEFLQAQFDFKLFDKDETKNPSRYLYTPTKFNVVLTEYGYDKCGFMVEKSSPNYVTDTKPPKEEWTKPSIPYIFPITNGCISSNSN